MCGEGDEWKIPFGFGSAKTARGIFASNDWHVDVHQNRAESVGLYLVNCRHRVVSGLFECLQVHFFVSLGVSELWRSPDQVTRGSV